MDMVWHHRFLSIEGLAGTKLEGHLTWHKLVIDQARAKAWLAEGTYLNLIRSGFICSQIGAKLDSTLIPSSAASDQAIEGGNEVLVVLPGEGGENTYQLYTATLRFSDKAELAWTADFSVQTLMGMHNALFGNDAEKPTLYGEEDKPIVRVYVLTLLQNILNKVDDEKPKVGGTTRSPQSIKERALEWVASIFRELREKDPMNSYRERMDILQKGVNRATS